MNKRAFVVVVEQQTAEKYETLMVRLVERQTEIPTATTIHKMISMRHLKLCSSQPPNKRTKQFQFIIFRSRYKYFSKRFYC